MADNTPDDDIAEIAALYRQLSVRRPMAAWFLRLVRAVISVRAL